MKLLAHSAAAEVATEWRTFSPLKRLTEAVEDLEHYVTDLLDLARFDGRSATPERHPVALQGIFQKIDLSFEDLASKRAAPLLLRATDVVLHTDSLMLQRILENLVSNAIKFTRGRVLVGARARNGGIAIEVWDQGPGIHSECQSSIFDAFYQGPPAGIDDQKGVGLGLTVVKRFADCMGYTIQVKSQLGRGSLMRVMIPAADVDNTSSRN
jgi:signal transduction histidine kinase